MFVNQEKIVIIHGGPQLWMKQINLLRNKKQVATRSVRILEYKLALMLTEALNECCYNRKKRRSK